MLCNYKNKEELFKLNDGQLQSLLKSVSCLCYDCTLNDMCEFLQILEEIIISKEMI